MGFVKSWSTDHKFSCRFESWQISSSIKYHLSTHAAKLELACVAVDRGWRACLKTESVSGGLRQVISLPCRGAKLWIQQSSIQMMMTAIDAPVGSCTRPFLLISLSEGEFSRVSTILLFYSSSWSKGLCAFEGKKERKKEKSTEIKTTVSEEEK